MIIETAVAASMYLAETELKKVPPVKTTIVADTIVIKPLPQEKIDKFKEWQKEDWYNDDPYKDMWDKNWIRK